MRFLFSGPGRTTGQNISAFVEPERRYRTRKTRSGERILRWLSGFLTSVPRIFVISGMAEFVILVENVGNVSLSCMLTEELLPCGVTETTSSGDLAVPPDQEPGIRYYTNLFTRQGLNPHQCLKVFSER
jgi:hypothetical protein